MKLSKGNSKIGRIANVSLTPIKACKGCAAVCGKDCYALKAYKQYPATKAAWDHNYEQATNKPDIFFAELYEELKKYKGTFFRWHVAGDILDQEYLWDMIKIADSFKHIKFLAFTKQYDVVNSIQPIFIPGNLKIVFSAWSGLPMDNPYNFPIAFMQDGSETRVNGNELECPGHCESCGMCWNLDSLNRNVVFNKH